MPRQTADAIIIGAGIVGTAIGFELAKRGLRTLNVDKNPGSGMGSTASSVGLIRTHYSTWNGVAMAHEGSFYWRDWAGYLEAEDERGLARFMGSGCVMIESERYDFDRLFRHYRGLGVEYEEWGPEELRRRIPIYEPGSYWPPKRPDQAAFPQRASTSSATGWSPATATLQPTAGRR